MPREETQRRGTVTLGDMELEWDDAKAAQKANRSDRAAGARDRWQPT
jgi:hypothetical protein